MGKDGNKLGVVLCLSLPPHSELYIAFSVLELIVALFWILFLKPVPFISMFLNKVWNFLKIRAFVAEIFAKQNWCLFSH